jgi:hypothetical protein
MTENDQIKRAKAELERVKTGLKECLEIIRGEDKH